MKDYLNTLIKRSAWYRSCFPHIKDYQDLKYNMDYLCIGSTPARYSIDFSLNHINGCNLSIMAETAEYDSKILKKYHTYLKPGGRVLFVLCPFTFLKDRYRREDGNNFYLNTRYFPVLPVSDIDYCNTKQFEYWNNPISSFYEVLPRVIIHKLRRIKKNQVNSMVDFNIHSEGRLKAWMEEFKMNELNSTKLPLELVNVIEKNIAIYSEMKYFLESKGYRGIIVIPPFSKELTRRIPDTFVNKTLFEPIHQIGFPYISFWNNESWMLKEYFQDSFLMNKKGRKALTCDIINRIKEIDDK